MTKFSWQKNRLLPLALALLLAAAPALADKPNRGGDDRHESKHEHHDDDDQQVGDQGHYSGRFFDDHHRSVIRNYYTEQHRSGHCPPGLAKKNNGCMPPGQLKKWAIGRQLPRDVVFYSLPREVVLQLGTPPARHRYVRVANDILLIMAGTGMVIDAIEDLSNQ